ncbi:DM13 domain-containing protein [Candidatus Uhrbacteria bacterium]|nr:DM13 domain-containing protein [Candidatus Uhrbacteria bacterium]
MKISAVTSLVLTLALLGAGCFGPRMYSTEELQEMTDDEKKAAMEEMLQDYPAPEFTKDQQKNEQKDMINVMANGTPERMADFVPQNLHDVTGKARIVKNGERYQVVFSEDFTVTPGPYLVVRIGGKEIGKLQSVSGAQVYDLPADFSLTQATDVNIFCKPFQVVFAIASFGN